MPGHRHSPPIRTTIQSGRGFTIQESLMFHQAQLAIPAFTRGKDQLDPVDVERTRGIANQGHPTKIFGKMSARKTI